MRAWVAGTLLAAGAAISGNLSPAQAEIKWDYVKPGSEKSVGRWLADILGVSDFGRDYAVIIGLSGFEYFNPLDATKGDPERLFEFLRDEAGFDYILMLRDKQVTYQTLRDLFEFELPNILRSNDRFLLFWSGHGKQFPDARGVERGYLPLISSPQDNKATMVNMADLTRWDDELPAKQALFLLDACFSGLAGVAAQDGEEDLKKAEIRELSKPGHHIISAGGSNQRTIASAQDWQGSIFTHALLKALRGEADRYGGKDGGDGLINLYELVADMGETVKHAKAAAGWNRPLRPILNVFPGRGEGQFFFLTEAKKRTYLEMKGVRPGDKMVRGMWVALGPAKEAPAQTGDPYGSRDDIAVFGAIRDSPIAKDFEDFLIQFPESLMASYARNRLAVLKQHETVTPPPDKTATIFNVVTSNGRPYPVDLVSLGSRVWIDREAIFSAIPDFLVGSAYIITANGDKFRKGERFLSFEITRPGDIFVAYDARYSRLPEWLRSFQATSYNVSFTFGADNYPMTLHRRHFDSGTIELGGPYPDGETGNFSMYSVFFRK